MELTKENKQRIYNIVQIVYADIDRSHKTPTHGIAEMYKTLQILHLYFPDDEEFEYACNVLTELLKGEFNEDYFN